MSRGDLRKALAILERQGELWRHVGKGTFIGARPVAELVSVAAIAAADQSGRGHARAARRSSRSWRARRRCTPPPTTSRRCSAAVAGARSAETWRQYENWDNRLHRAIAEAAHNALLLAALRHAERGAPRGRLGPPPRRGPASAGRPPQLRRARGDRGRRSRSATSPARRRACAFTWRRCRRCSFRRACRGSSGRQ